MPHFSPQDYGPVLQELRSNAPTMPLDMGTPNTKARPMLARLTPENLFAATGRRVANEEMARACLAGLWLRHNFFDESHELSQEIATPTGGFWHAILHRREPDYGNARYWFHQVGAHPVFPALAAAVGDAGWPKSSRWDPMAFISAVQAARRTADPASLELCVRVQQIEWELLFDYSWRETFYA